MAVKVLVVGNYSYHRLSPALRLLQAETMLVGWGRQHAALADRFVPAPAEVAPEQVVRWALEWGADLVLSSVIPLTESAGIRDAIAREILGSRHGVRMVAHPVETAALAADKVYARHWLTAHGYPVPAGAVVTGLSELRKYLGHPDRFPCVLKTPLGVGNRGVRVVHSWAEAEAAYSTMVLGDTRLVVEEFLDGQELGLELLSVSGQRYVFPPASLGQTAAGHPMARIRVAPAALSPAVLQQVNTIAQGLLHDLALDGPLQLDLVVREGRVFILELNGRLGGVSNLSYAASGVDPYGAVLDMALGSWQPDEHGEPGVGIDVPVAAGLSDTFTAWAEGNPHVIEVRHRIDGDWSVSLKAASTDQLLQVFESMPEGCCRVTLAEVRLELARSIRDEVLL